MIGAYIVPKELIDQLYNELRLVRGWVESEHHDYTAVYDLAGDVVDRLDTIIDGQNNLMKLAIGGHSLVKHTELERLHQLVGMASAALEDAISPWDVVSDLYQPDWECLTPFVDDQSAAW